MTHHQPINVGMVGYKFMGKAHSHAYKDVGMFFDLDTDVNMHTICGRDEEGVYKAAKKFGWSHAVTDWKKLIEQDEIDLIDVNTPTNVHKDIIIAAARAGKHVFCEKPLAMSLSDAQEMVTVVKQTGVKHAICFNYRFLPAVQLAKQLIMDGKIGDIYHYRATYLQDWLVDRHHPLHWKLQIEMAGSGAHGDLNAHTVDLARFLIGEFDCVIGQRKTFIKNRPISSSSPESNGLSEPLYGEVTVDDTTTFLAQFKNGAVGTFEASRLAAGWKNGNTFEVNGSKGSLRFNLERLNELQVYFCDDVSHIQGFRTILATESIHPFASNWWPPGHTIGYEHGFVNLISEFIQSITRNKPFAPNFEDGYECQKVLEAVDRSIETGKWAAVNENFLQNCPN